MSGLQFKQTKLFDNRPDLPQIELAPVRSSLKPIMWEDDNDWVAEIKLDGIRIRCHICETENRFFTKHKSVKDGLFSERTDNIPHLRNLELGHLSGTVLDGEIITGKNVSDVMSVMGGSVRHSLDYQNAHGKALYVVFDVLFFKGVDVRWTSYGVRREILEDICKEIDNSHITVVGRMLSNKRIFYEDILETGGEGIVLKNIKAPYGELWAKAKRESTYDVVIMGFAEPEKFTQKVTGETTLSRFALHGWVGSIRFGQWKNGKLTEMGTCSGMSDEIREMFSKNPEDFINTVIEIKAQERTESGAFRHPAFVRIRSDKESSDCVFNINER
jgi:ATP-dependent DNA ligase